MSKSDNESDNDSESTESDIESEDEYTKTFEGQFSTKDLENMIKEDGIISYDPVCVRKRSNWSTGNNQYKFDNPEFSQEKLLDDIHDHSPKLHVLLDKIEKLDILRSIRTMPFVEKKANWAMNWMKGSDANFAITDCP